MNGSSTRRVAQVLPWLLAAFPVALMLSSAAARNLAIALAVAGLLMQTLPGRPFDRRDLDFALAAAVLPAVYLLNMAVCGWSLKLFDRPAHLLWAIPVYLLVRRCGASPKTVLAGLAFGGVAAGAVALLADKGLLGSGELARLDQGRPMGPYSSPGAFGNYSAVIAMACLAGGLAWAQHRTRAWLRPLVLLGLVGGVGAALLSETRSAWAAMPVMAALGVAVLGQGGPRRRWLAVAGIVVVLGVALLFIDVVRERLLLGIGEVQAYLADPSAPGARETSMGLRLLSWQWGWEQFLAHPVFGIGLAGFRPAVDAAVAAGTLPAVLGSFSGLHNLVVDHLAKTGLVGTAAMALFWIGMFRYFLGARRVADPYKRLFVALGLMLLAGELIFASVGSMFASALGTVAFTVLLAVFAAGAHPATPSRA